MSEMKKQPLLRRQSSMLARRASNKNWCGDQGRDLTEEFAVKHAVVNTICRRSTHMNLEEEGATGLAKVERAMSMMIEKTVAGPTDTEGEHYDDHPELMTNGQAVLNLLNNCLGSGLLGTGFACMKMGYIGGPLTLIFSALINRYTVLMHMESSKLAGEDPATTHTAEKALKAGGKVVQLIIFFGIGFSCLVSYLTATTDAVTDLLKLIPGKQPLEGNRVLTMVCCFFVLICPPTTVRSMTSMATCSMIAFIGAIIMVIAILLSCGSTLAVTGIDIDELNMFPTSFANFAYGFPTMIMLFGIQAGTGPILGCMKDGSEKNIKKQANTVMTIIVCLNIILGLGVYATFKDGTESDVLASLDSDLLGIIARLGALVLVVLSYMIMMVPCRLSTIEAVFGKNEALMEATLPEFYLTTAVLNCIALGVSLCVSDLSVVFAFMSACISPVLSWFLPCSVMIKILALPEVQDRPLFSPKNTPYYVVILFGVSMVYFGFISLVSALKGE